MFFIKAAIAMVTTEGLTSEGKIMRGNILQREKFPSAILGRGFRGGNISVLPAQDRHLNNVGVRTHTPVVQNCVVHGLVRLVGTVGAVKVKRPTGWFPV